MTEAKRRWLRKGWRAVPLPARFERGLRAAVRRRLDADAFWSNLPESVRRLTIGPRSVAAAHYAPPERGLCMGER